MPGKKLVLTGGAGFVGQNLVARLNKRDYREIVVLDKHRANLDILRQLHPEITAEWADLAEPGDWRRHFEGCDLAVMLQAQIFGNDYQEFVRNSEDSAGLVLEALKQHGASYLVHISSVIIESVVDNFYSITKSRQERMALESGVPCVALRPSLMYGCFDRHGFGWLARFMQKTPIFPVISHGRYLRQPLYVGDFCNVIIACLESLDYRGVYTIAGHEGHDYIDLMRQYKRMMGCRTPFVHVPYWAFYSMLWTWRLLYRKSHLTPLQLTAFTAGDKFKVIDWPGIFGVPYTPFHEGLEQTFNDPRYRGILLEA